MSEQAFNLDRDTNLKNNIDAFGKKWSIFSPKSSALMVAISEPKSKPPQLMQGQWTSKDLLMSRIRQHVKESWAQADLADVRAERKRELAREAKTKTKAKDKVEA